MTALVVPIIDFGANKHIYSLYLFAGFIRIMKQLYVTVPGRVTPRRVTTCLKDL